MVRFRDLESIPELGTESALEQWYHAAREKDLTELSDDDLCRACRQNVFLDHVVPIALDRIKRSPIAGDQYDGELVSAVSRIQRRFWDCNPEIERTSKRVLEEALSELDDDNVRQVVLAFLHSPKS